MADTAKCFALVKGRALRVTKLDSCGNPVLGPGSQVVTKGFISVALSAQTDEGTDINVTNANGDTCVRDDATPEFLGYSVEISLCGVDPDLVSFLTGQAVVRDDTAVTPLSIGFDVGTDVDLSATAFALEMWSVVPGQACVAGDKAYGYFLLPFVQGGNLGDFTVQNDAVNFTVSAAKTQDGNAWGVGPYNVLKTVAGVDSPLLSNIGINKHLRVIQVTKAPPTVGACGAQALGVPATSAVAGIPGHYLPTNSYGPANLAASTGLVASPSSAWTAGQYVTTRDGALMHWNATAWVAGAA